jgi:recombination protein RecR
MEYPSKLIEDAVKAFAKLPGVGSKTALRLVLHLLKTDDESARELGQAIIRLKDEVQYCRLCHNISDDELCSICRDTARDHKVVCLVEDMRDVMAIENTGQYTGTYHILGGLISPMDGVGPENLNVQSLIDRVKEQGVKEVIMAMSTTMEGDTTMFYLSKQLQPLGVTISSISRGIAIGGELEYTDEVTLARSIAERVPYAQ